MDHYFARRPAAPSRPREVRARLRGREWAFLSDRGVFAHRGVDAGTRLLAETMVIGPSDDVLDLGCGYGPVGIIAATLAPSGRVAMVDLNERAVALAAENVRRHGLSNADVLHGDGCAPVAGREFDVVATNPPIRAGKATLRRLVREVWGCLRPGGRFYLVARTAQGAKSLARDMAEVFGEVREIAKGSGYRVYEATKRTDDRQTTNDDR